MDSLTLAAELREEAAKLGSPTAGMFPVADLLTRAAEAIERGVPEGWKIVPVASTEPMREAGWLADGGDPDDPERLRILREYELIWNAMLSSSPSPPRDR